MNIKRYIAIVAATMMVVGAWAQNATSSPSSRFGYGKLNENIPTAYRSMGGVGTGIRSNRAINPAQPASYTACDSMTFMFDIAGSFLYTNYGDANGVTNKMNGNLEYVTMQFPIWRQHIAMSLGVNPYSAVGYNFSQSDSINQDYYYTKTYKGIGGFTQVYGGLSVNICNWLALGANVYYMFGDITQQRSLTFSNAQMDSVQQMSYLDANSLRLRYGAQLFHTFGKHTVTLGAVYENKQRFSRMEYQQIETTTKDTVSTMNEGFEMPMMYSVGLSYEYDNRILVAVDYQCYDWNNVKYFGQDQQLKNLHRWAAGVQYRNDPTSRKYVDRVYWRIGANYSTSYTKEFSSPELGLSIGVGLPLRNVGTTINAAVEYGRRGWNIGKGSQTSNLTENYLKLVINASIAEHWFFKRKL